MVINMPAATTVEASRDVKPHHTRRGIAQTRVRQQQFLRHFSRLGAVAPACAKTGIDRTTIYRWLRDDPSFAAGFQDAAQEAVEWARGALFELASKHQHLGAIMAILRRFDPDFRESPKVIQSSVVVPLRTSPASLRVENLSDEELRQLEQLLVKAGAGLPLLPSGPVDERF